MKKNQSKSKPEGAEQPSPKGLSSSALLALASGVLVIGGVFFAEAFRGHPVYWLGFCSVAVGGLIALFSIEHP